MALAEDPYAMAKYLSLSDHEKRAVTREAVPGANAGGSTARRMPVKKAAKPGRNDPCPCGSGLKWKKCECKEYHS